MGVWDMNARDIVFLRGVSLVKVICVGPDLPGNTPKSCDAVVIHSFEEMLGWKKPRKKAPYSAWELRVRGRADMTWLLNLSRVIIVQEQMEQETFQ